MNNKWLELIQKTLDSGASVSPRGQLTRELRNHAFEVDMRHCVLTVPGRKLSYKFMAAEAWWIMSGSNFVSTIAPYNKNISQYSDNGKTFAGAYGPRVVKQLEYVCEKLIEDGDTRQAGMTIWKKNPAPSKDIPCTVAVWWQLRGDKLHCTDFMRSSDQWMGLPYDVFNFSMLSAYICSVLNRHAPRANLVVPGTLTLVAASSHLYERNFSEAYSVLSENAVADGPAMPAVMYDGRLEFIQFKEALKQLADSKRGDPLRWWEGNHGTSD